MEVTRHSPFGPQTVGVDLLDWLEEMQASVLHSSQTHLACVYIESHNIAPCDLRGWSVEEVAQRATSWLKDAWSLKASV